MRCRKEVTSFLDSFANASSERTFSCARRINSMEETFVIATSTSADKPSRIWRFSSTKRSAFLWMFSIRSCVLSLSTLFVPPVFSTNLVRSSRVTRSFSACATLTTSRIRSRIAEVRSCLTVCSSKEIPVAVARAKTA